MAVLERMLTKFDIAESGCWEWTAHRDARGYGVIGVNNSSRKAHRVLWEQIVGPIPEGLELDHLCHNRCCVNPDHLEPVTHAENVRRGRSGKHWSERTHCEHGHEFTPENIYEYRGLRQCRTCRRAAWRESKRRKKAA